MGADANVMFSISSLPEYHTSSVVIETSSGGGAPLLLNIQYSLARCFLTMMRSFFYRKPLLTKRNFRRFFSV